MIASTKFVFITLCFLAIQFSASASTLAKADMRIVSAGGSITEILYALGMQASIVGTDTSSSYPDDVSGLPKVGYYRQLSTEGVLKLKPSHVFAVKGLGPDAVLQQLESMGVTIYVFEQERSEQGLKDLVMQIAQKLGREEQAKDLNAQITRQLAQLPSINNALKPSFLMSVNERGLMAAGDNTVPNLLFKALKLNNPFTEFEGFKPISSESLLASGTNIIFLPQHQARGMSPIKLCELAALSTWAKIHGCNLHVVDSLMFLGLTPRLALAAEQMAHAINAAP
ncbi:hemin ABC transporter substrate-binding protein [Glaciecola sp. SC05]|uniref:heme/hemin ABC transporter substrate-binding protein n=1 Tax=Glaciecola sp. SC05 TaxID=1987355 RepID=UPI003529C8F9